MVTSRQTLEKIREIIAKHYSKFAISMLGRSAFSKADLALMQAAGIDTSNKSSFLEMVYVHSFLNNPRNSDSPTSVEDMEAQQSQPEVKPKGEANEYTVENLNDKVKQLIDKLRADVSTRIEGFIRDNNDQFKFNSLANLDRPDALDELVKESTLGRVKQKLRDSSKDANRDWQRVALTEMSNAIGIGSVDRIVTDNREADLDEIYVFRQIVGDSLTCRDCRRLYGDVGEAPKVYRLSTILANGSNYGKKRDTYSPVVGATHVNSRTGPVTELKPGFAVRPGGTVTYIGLAKWSSYIHEVLIN